MSGMAAANESKDRLHEVVDALPNDQADVLLHRLEDPVARVFLLAPDDDEGELSDEAGAAIDEGLAEMGRGDTISLEDFKRDPS